MKYFNGIMRFGFLLLLPLTSYAGVASERLDDFFANVKTLQADFHQTLIDDKGNTVKEANGVLVMQRPGKFRWDYLQPYKQLIVADGKKIWVYDSELEQVTVKPMDAALGSTPALLLSGTKPLQENFIITELGPSDGLEWVELSPKVPDSSFERVRLAFDKTNLQRMELVDNFGQLTWLEFKKLERNVHPDPKLFVFSPPVGVDIIGDTN